MVRPSSNLHDFRMPCAFRRNSSIALAFISKAVETILQMGHRFRLRIRAFLHFRKLQSRHMRDMQWHLRCDFCSFPHRVWHLNATFCSDWLRKIMPSTLEHYCVRSSERCWLLAHLQVVADRFPGENILIVSHGEVSNPRATMLSTAARRPAIVK